MINNRQQDFLCYREQYKTFIYEAYNYDILDSSIEITYHFTIDGLISFHPTWSIPLKEIFAYSKEKVEQLIFSLGMVELISYWKTVASKKLVIACGYLNEEQISWWKKLYFHGLGEFFYLNNITCTQEDFMEITCEKEENFPITSPVDSLDCDVSKVMIPVGGGKDSTVSIEVLANSEYQRYCYIINPRKATLETVETAGLMEGTLFAKRRLDQNLLELNRRGFLNGHTPFSAIVAFSSVLTAYVNGISYVALSNESSANESTVEGSSVNHQYSKSFEFEQDFREYEAAYIQTKVSYFSFLRPLSELQIAHIFSSLEKYYSVFKSCNVGSKTDIWCGHCSKCLFVYIIMSPFISREDLISIFGHDLLNDETLLLDFEKLTGLLPEKPFECVGSRDEVCTALSSTLSQYEESFENLPYLLQHFVNKVDYKQFNMANYQSHFEQEHYLPEPLLALLKRKLKELS